MNKVKFLFTLLVMVALSVGYTSCSSDKEDDPAKEQKDDFNISLTLPSAVEVVRSEGVTLTLTGGGPALATDRVQLQNADGTFISCEVTPVGNDAFTFSLPEKVVDGTYRVYYRRGDRSKNLGTIKLTILRYRIDLEPGTNVYGEITCGGEPVADVLVSDGFEFVKTDANGVYQLNSAKERRYVFMVVPSGYDPVQKGVFPGHFKVISGDTKTPESANFELVKVNQTNHTVLYMGDMHIANRNNDKAQFAQFAADVAKYRASHPGDKIYGITLGDMTWDIYWYDNKFAPADYVKYINEQMIDLPMYHTIGNHDNDYLTTDNWNAKNPFSTTVAPNYYSFNIGEVHYIALDDIDCSTYDGTSSRNYTEQLLATELDWLRKDLSYVDKSTPVVLTMHAPVFRPITATQFDYGLKNARELCDILAGYTVKIVTGHTHKNYNVRPSHDVIAGRTIEERNVIATCGDWWWSGKLTPGCLMAPDGVPAGYTICDVKGKDFAWLYKGTNRDTDKQFHSYDLNNVKFDMSTADKQDAKGKTSFQRYVNAYPGTQNNEVLLNVFNYNPSWTITVTTADGQSLTPVQQYAYDPFHILAMSCKRFAATTSTPNFITSSYPHFFRVKCPDADTDLTITVKDEFGHTWTEEMKRPKAFDEATYKW